MTTTTTTTMMMNNEDEWPSLTPPNDDNEWELLNSHTQQQQQDAAFELVVAPSSPLRHCNSSPNLKTMQTPVNSNVFDNNNNLASVAEDTNTGSDSFTLVSNPTSSSGGGGGAMNFRRAILDSSSGTQTTNNTSPPTTPLPNNNNNKTIRKALSPRFVVVPVLRRCSKSTGDLLQHAANAALDDENPHSSWHPDNDDDDDHMHDDQYFNQKAMGTASFTAGRKLRPDEAKRKEYSVRKKQLQRQRGQQQQQG